MKIEYKKFMSTKSTIAYGEEFHLYNECWEDDCVYLELEGNPKYEVSPGSVTVRIPAHIWEVIRTFSGIMLDLADKGDADIRAMVEKHVDERIARWRKARSKREKAWVSFGGGLVYGTADAPRAKQIQSGFKEMILRRNQQRDIQLKIQRLALENSPEGRRKRLEEHNRKAARHQAARKVAETRKKAKVL
jgi:hypothetical protein